MWYDVSTTFFVGQTTRSYEVWDSFTPRFYFILFCFVSGDKLLDLVWNSFFSMPGIVKGCQCWQEKSRAVVRGGGQTNRASGDRSECCLN